jgi:hypothetical protein
MDPIRSQRDLKLRPHLHLPGFDRSLYIDNSVVLKSRPEDLFQAYLSDGPFALPSHSYRLSVLDEFIEVARSGFDDPARIFEQLNHYAIEDSAVLEEKPFWTAILLREHDDPACRKMAELWAAHVFRYSRRDQLSVNLAFRRVGLAPKTIEIDNLGSWFHNWPITWERERFKGERNVTQSLSPLVARWRQAEQKLAETEDALEKERQRSGAQRAELDETADALEKLRQRNGVLKEELENAAERSSAAEAQLAEARQAKAHENTAHSLAMAECDRLRGEIEALRVAHGETQTQAAEWRSRYAVLRKRSILRLPRAFIRGD